MVGLLFLSMCPIFAPQVKAQATSNTSDPTDDLYYYQSGSPAPTWPVMDIVYAEISQVDSANIKLLIKASQPIPLTNEWQGYYWLLDTATPAPPYWNPIDSNDIVVSYYVAVHWAETGPLAVDVVNAIDGTTIFHEDARDNPEKHFSDDTCFISIPLSWIGNPTSIKWVANSVDGVADPSGRHDKAPNTGHATLTIAPTEPDLEARRILYENYAEMIDLWIWENKYEELTELVVEDALRNYYDPLEILISWAKNIARRAGVYYYTWAWDLTEAIVETWGWWQVGIVIVVMGFAYSEAIVEYLYKYDTAPPDAPDEMTRIYNLIESGETREAQKDIRMLLNYLEIVKEQTINAPLPPGASEDYHTSVANIFFAVIAFLSGEYNSIGASLKVSLGSPADLHVYDPIGRHIGFNYETSEIEVEIPYAYYSGPSAEIQNIAIPSPLPGVYIIDRYGTNTGTYTIIIESVAPDGTVVDSETWTGTTSSGELKRGSIQLFEDGSFVGQIFGVIPEVPLGTIMASAAMIIALVAYIELPKWRRKRKYFNQ